MIRKASPNDILDIMQFINSYWKKGHILGVDHEFFEYEHRNGNEINYIISIDDYKNIEAILGYIPYGKLNRDVMTVMWKVKNNDKPFLGVQLLEYLINNCDVRIASSPGINQKTIPIYEYLGYTVGKLKHYYRLNKCSEYKIAQIHDDRILTQEKQDIHYSLLPIHHMKELMDIFNFEEYKSRNPKPYKEPWYIEKRYFNHPIYTYKVFGIKDGLGKVESVLFTREVSYKSSKILRIMDFIGNIEKLNHISNDIDTIMQNNNYEYVDFYQSGIPNEIMESAGFILKDSKHNIIPNYFEPYVPENIEIYYFSTSKDVVLFKADGDQDRPSIPRTNNITKL